MNAFATTHRELLPRAVVTLLLVIALWSLPGSARAQVYVGQDTANKVGEYDGISGAPIGAFTPITSLVEPDGLVRWGNTLFVSSYNGESVGTYNATTGTALQASFITTGLSGPVGLALQVSNNILFVANFGNNTVGTYNATTGVAFNTSFITGDHNADALALFGSTLYVYSTDGRVDTYTVNSATSSTPLQSNFITGVSGGGGLALSADGTDLYVTSGGSTGVVGEYNASNGNPIQTLVTGLNDPLGVAVAGTSLYVANQGSGVVGQYNASNGSPIQTSLITASGADSLAFVPEPGSAALLALGSSALLGWRRRRSVQAPPVAA